MSDQAPRVEVVDLLKVEMQETVGDGTPFAGSYTGLCGDRAKELSCSVSILPPGCFSNPYHFHHGEEEVFILLDGAATLRTPDGFREVQAGDLLFCPTGPGGAHQLYNHTDADCRFFALSNRAKIDAGEFPDSEKIFFRGTRTAFRHADAVKYHHGEEEPSAFWPDAIVPGSRDRGGEER